MVAMGVSFIQCYFFKPVFLRTVIPRMSILKPTYLDLGVRYSVPFDVILKLRVSSIQINNNM